MHTVESGEREPVIRLRDLTVTYGTVRALDGIDLDLRPGAIGLLGPNGAGKTTLLKVLLGMLRPKDARVQINGLEPTTRAGRLAIRQQVGYMPEGPCLLPGMTGVEIVVTLARLSGMSRALALTRAHDAIDAAGLDESRYRDASTYSLGMQQRLKLAQALVHDPPVLLLDEPTNGLDPRGRASMLKHIRKLSVEEGKTVVLCSHLLQDVERACDEVVILHEGRVREQGPIAHITRDDGRWWRVGTTDASRAQALGAALGQHGIEWEPGDEASLRVLLHGDVDSADDIITVAGAAGIPVIHVEPVGRSLEEAFFALLGEADR